MEHMENDNHMENHSILPENPDKESEHKQPINCTGWLGYHGKALNAIWALKRVHWISKDVFRVILHYVPHHPKPPILFHSTDI